MIRPVIIFLTIINSYIFGQQCFSDAGQDKTVCGGKKVGSNYRVYLDGTNSSITNGSLNYEWSSLDDGISFSSSQSRRAEPYFNYPQSLTEDKQFRIQLRVYDDDGNVVGEVKGSARMLAGMIKQVNQNVQKKYSIGKPNFLQVPVVQDFSKKKQGFISRLNKLKSQFALNDNDTLALYHQSFCLIS